MKAAADKKKLAHKHDWFPVAFDYDSAFGFYECAECFQHGWRNLHRVDHVEEAPELPDE